MLKRRLSIIVSALLAVALQTATSPSAYAQATSDPPPGKAGRPTPAQRRAAGARRKAQVEAARKAGKPLPRLPIPGGQPDYFGTISQNWAFTPIIPKFVDDLPGLGPTGANLLGQYLPVAVADTTTFPGSDYYELGLVEFTEKMHSNLPATKLRGYVQLATGVVAGLATELKYLDGSTILVNGSNRFPVDNPHYLGPLIIGTGQSTLNAAKPVRILFRNLLPAGPTGNLKIPVDLSYMGAGMGTDPTGAPVTYTQNRATLHLHGGVTPWISDGTPHQWITPELQSPVGTQLRGDSVAMVPDMWFDATTHAAVPSCNGLVTCNVANSTNDPGPGAQTFYWTNQQSARLMFYHDHAYGITRLNVYAGEAAGFLLTDAVEQTLVNGGTLPDPFAPAGPPLAIAAGTVPADRIPLVIQDKTWVDPTTIVNTDPTWNWGTTPGTPVAGDLWFPHVYNVNQNPADIFGTNNIGRWDYGQWFWPPMSPTQMQNPDVINDYYDPILAPWENITVPGMKDQPSGVPEAFMDTPLVNGTPYPVLHLEPKAYRFNILNAANDRFLNLQLYFADPLALTEVKMLPAVPHVAVPTDGSLPLCPIGVTVGTAALNPPIGCWPATDINGDSAAGWPTDGRDGGVPDPTTAGPSFFMIGNEAGLLPQLSKIDNRPVVYEFARRSITVLNVYGKALFMAPAERADVVVDFTGLAGSTLILYNDAPAPVPAFDPRVDYYTGDPDQSMDPVLGNFTGGAPDDGRRLRAQHPDHHADQGRQDPDDGRSAGPRRPRHRAPGGFRGFAAGSRRPRAGLLSRLRDRVPRRVRAHSGHVSHLHTDERCAGAERRQHHDREPGLGLPRRSRGQHRSGRLRHRLGRHGDGFHRGWPRHPHRGLRHGHGLRLRSDDLDRSSSDWRDGHRDRCPRRRAAAQGHPRAVREQLRQDERHPRVRAALHQLPDPDHDPAGVRRPGHRDLQAGREPALEDHAQRRRHARHPLPPLQRPDHQPRGLGRRREAASRVGSSAGKTRSS